MRQARQLWPFLPMEHPGLLPVLPSWMTASVSRSIYCNECNIYISGQSTGNSSVANVVFTSLTATKTHVITQAAAPATISIDQSAKTVESVSGSFSVAVTTNSATWKATGVPAWVTLTPSESTGSGNVVVNYTQNTTNTPREAT